MIMAINLVCIGDVVGSPGRQILKDALPPLVAARAVDCAVVNAENAAQGSGLTPELYKKVMNAGANLITLGDHIYRRGEIIPLLESRDNIVRPANLPAQAPGKEFAIFNTPRGPRVAVLSLLGRQYMKVPVNCPFAAADRVLRLIPSDVKIIVLDMHAEATSEKIAMGWHLDGRVTAVVGTHTHIPTADERILPKGTAYISDLGMTGPYDSVLGRSKTAVLSSLISSVPTRYEVAEGDVRMCGVFISVDQTTGRALSIERVRVDADAAARTPQM